MYFFNVAVISSIRAQMLGPLTLADLPMSFQPTWEWSSIKRLEEYPAARYWHDCSRATCGYLDKLYEKMDTAVGSKVGFVDMYGTHRKFDVIEAAEDGSKAFTLRHSKIMNEGTVTLKVRAVSMKLLEAKYNMENLKIEIYSKISGNMMLEFPFAEHSHSSWTMFTHHCNKALRLPEGRTILFPPDMEDPEQIAQWTKKPQGRAQVRSLLKVITTVKKQKKQKKEKRRPKL